MGEITNTVITALAWLSEKSSPSLTLPRHTAMKRAPVRPPSSSSETTPFLRTSCQSDEINLSSFVCGALLERICQMFYTFWKTQKQANNRVEKTTLMLRVLDDSVKAVHEIVEVGFVAPSRLTNYCFALGYFVIHSSVLEKKGHTDRRWSPSCKEARTKEKRFFLQGEKQNNLLAISWPICPAFCKMRQRAEHRVVLSEIN